MVHCADMFETVPNSYIMTLNQGLNVDLFKDKTQSRIDTYAFRYFYTNNLFPSMYM